MKLLIAVALMALLIAVSAYLVEGRRKPIEEPRQLNVTEEGKNYSGGVICPVSKR